MTYQRTLDYMYSKLPMFSRIGSDAVKKGFKNILALSKALENPHQKGKFVHIAGTNGKGSVSHMFASVFQSAGYKTGLYTSPHLRDFRERIKIDGKMIDEADVIAFIKKMTLAIEAIKPSFFEITVAMAFDYFANNNVDVAVIETGLGGRLDSTNIIAPELSVITNIGFDHMHVLGDTMEKIASEKAGIIKSNTPVVIGEKQSDTENIFIKKANENNAPISFASDTFAIADWYHQKEQLVVEVAEKHHVNHKKYHLDLTAQYQTKNLITVLEGVKRLKLGGFFEFTDEQINKGLQNTKKQTGLYGRWETIHNHPRIVLDVAHNESGIKELLKQLELTTYHHLHIILGMVKDKDVDGVLPLFPPTATYYFTNAHIPRAMPSGELQLKAAASKLLGHQFDNVNDAIQAAKNTSHPDDLILVCGSVFLVGEVERIR